MATSASPDFGIVIMMPEEFHDGREQLLIKHIILSKYVFRRHLKRDFERTVTLKACVLFVR